MRSATYYLDTAPSVNHLYANIRGRGRVKSREYTNWVNASLKELIVQKARPVTMPVAITIELPETMRGDLDGRLKASIDIMVRAGVIEDDNNRCVRSVSATFYDGKRMRVTVQSLRTED